MPLRKREIQFKNAWENRLSVRRREEEMMLIYGEVLSFNATTHVLRLGIMIHHVMDP